MLQTTLICDFKGNLIICSKFYSFCELVYNSKYGFFIPIVVFIEFFRVFREIGFFRWIYRSRNKKTFDRNVKFPVSSKYLKKTQKKLSDSIKLKKAKLTDALKIMFLTIRLAIQLEKTTLIKGTTSRLMTDKTIRVPIATQCCCINRQNRKTTWNTFWRNLLWVTVLAKGLTEKTIIVLDFFCPRSK